MTKETLVKLSAELEICGKALLKIAEALRSEEKAPAPESPKKEPVPRTLTLEEVRKVAADKSRQGFTEEVRNLIHHYGADKLSSLNPEKYDAFLKDLEVMGHAGNHAVLSASSSYRWLACPPSALECARLPDVQSDFAKQGTEAHALCEYKVKKALGQKGKDPTKSLTYFDEEMAECTDAYAQFVLETLAAAKTTCKDPLVLVEQRLDFSRWVPEGFGTGDCLIVADDTLSVIDYKHGLGVLVEAEKNPQMMCYALGALELFDGICDIQKVSMTIFQPRRENVSTCTLSKEELLQWAETVLKPTAELASRGEGEYKAGDHCRFCKIRATCRKRAEYNLELAKYDFAMPFHPGRYRSGSHPGQSR